MLFIMPRPEPVLAAMLQGVTLKVKLAWANANFEFPMLLSHETDLQSPALLYAYVVPPIAYYITRFYIWRPLARRRRMQQVQSCRHPPPLLPLLLLLLLLLLSFYYLKLALNLNMLEIGIC